MAVAVAVTVGIAVGIAVTIPEVAGFGMGPVFVMGTVGHLKAAGM